MIILIRVFLGIANTMIKGQNISNVEEDTLASSTLIRSQLKFVKSLVKKDNGLNFEWKYYQNDNHFSVPLITTYDGLRFLFDWYRFESRDELYWSPDDESLELLKSHYKMYHKKWDTKISLMRR